MNVRCFCCRLRFSLLPRLLHCSRNSSVSYLSGRDKDHTVPWKFLCTTGAKSGEWTTIPVPSNWDVLGFGMLNYKKDIETALEEHGLYEYEFERTAGVVRQTRVLGLRRRR